MAAPEPAPPFTRVYPARLFWFKTLFVAAGFPAEREAIAMKMIDFVLDWHICAGGKPSVRYRVCSPVHCPNESFHRTSAYQRLNPSKKRRIPFSVEPAAAAVAGGIFLPFSKE
jgi:hypothetical protein